MKKIFRILLLALVCCMLPLTAAGKANAAEASLSSSKKTTYSGKGFSLTLDNAAGSVEWLSSDEKIATVTNGKVSAHTAGTVTITAKYNNVSYSCEVTVKEPFLNFSSKRVMVGKSFSLVPQGTKALSYFTQNDRIASVDENGTVTAKDSGKTVIYVKCSNGRTYACSITTYMPIQLKENPSFEDLAPTVNMSFEELVGDNGIYDLPKGFAQVGTYKLIVDLYHKVVLAYAMDDNGKYTIPVRYMLCSVGAPETPTPTGTFKMESFRLRYEIFANTNSYAQYWSIIKGRIYFHSILYSSFDASDYTGSWNNLGKAVSHGCIRLTVPDARWIWYNVAPGSTIVIRSGSSDDKATAEIRSKLKLASMPSTRAKLKKGQVPYTDNWSMEDVPHEVDFVQGSQNGGEAAY
ncbi:MAG: L,D-transpeptidase family protein [Lachnospiraceae bacterium]|nr:L,D-transpeptidase family protein [Lachnospiraceae bacterium]